MESIENVIKKLKDNWTALSLFEKVLVIAVVWAIAERVGRKK